MKQEKEIFGILQTALHKIFKALARLVLRFGLSYEQFDELAKQAFVEVAEQDFTLPGRKQTDSRIAVVTGLSRKEVKRLRELEHGSETVATPAQYNRAARVLNGWLQNKAYLDEGGAPLVLPMDGAKASFEGAEGSFTRLVRDYGGDIPVRAVLAELVRIGAVAHLKDDKVQVIQQAYVPTDNVEDKLIILGTDVMSLIDTITHNLTEPSEKNYLQLKVSYDNLPTEALPMLHKIAAEDGQFFLQQLNRWFMSKDRDANPQATGTGRHYAGVGVYFFTKDISDKEK
jgi:hypothetical protein